MIVPIEKDRYGRTVAEVYVKDSQSTDINLNVQMVRDGYAWHYKQYSGSCPIRGEEGDRSRDGSERRFGNLERVTWFWRVPTNRMSQLSDCFLRFPNLLISIILV